MTECWLNEICERAATGRCELMIDIGANLGEWAAWGVNSFKKVVAIDCDKRAAAALKRRFAINQSVEVMYKAVSRQPGQVAVYQRPSSEQTSLLEEHPIGGCGQAAAPVEVIEFVEATTIDTLIAQYGEPDFIKVDVEGAEALVLAGATLPAARRARWLIEVHDTSEAVRAQVERLGWTNCTRISHPSPSAHPQHYWIYLEGQP